MVRVIGPLVALLVSLAGIAVGLVLSPFPWLAPLVLGGFGLWVTLERDWGGDQ